MEVQRWHAGLECGTSALAAADGVLLVAGERGVALCATKDRSVVARLLQGNVVFFFSFLFIFFLLPLID